MTDLELTVACRLAILMSGMLLIGLGITTHTGDKLLDFMAKFLATLLSLALIILFLFIKEVKFIP